MNARIIRIVCALYMVAMSLAAGTHWWSLRTLTSVAKASPSHSQIPSARLTPTTPPKTNATPGLANTPVLATPTPATAPSSRDEFYTTLLRQIENLQNQNRDLIDQLAETNRELMKLEFRVDTHSSQFRPLPVTEERQEANIDDSYGVLPPRPLLIDEPYSE